MRRAVQVQASYSEVWKVIKGVPQGGPSTPGFYGDYTVGIPMATLKCTEWKQGKEENRQRLQQAIELGEHTYWTSWVSRRTLAKEHKSEEEWHDLRIMYEKGYEYLQEREMTEI